MNDFATRLILSRVPFRGSVFRHSGQFSHLPFDSRMGDFALAVIVSTGDLFAHVIGKILGRTIHLEREKAQEIGQIVVLSLVIGAGIVVTILYS